MNIKELIKKFSLFGVDINFINLRGGLGNQIIQLSYVINSGKNPVANINAVNLRRQLQYFKGVEYVNSKIMNLLMGSARKLSFFLTSSNIDLSCFGFNDGYFQFGDLTKIIPKKLEEHLLSQIVVDSNILSTIDIVLHVRGGDYFTASALKVYERCDESYYSIALNQALLKLNKHNATIFIVTNDKKYATILLHKLIDTEQHNVNYYYKSEWSDFSLIQRAEIAIIPNSTFSMTARMLNKNGITIAPKKWFTIQSKFTTPFCANFIYIESCK
jgi:hypothetical protein